MPPSVSFMSSLRSRLILLIVVAILPWIAAMAYYMWSAWQTATAAAVEEGRQLTRSIAQEEGRALQEAHNLLRVLVSLPEVRTGTEAACSASLQAIRAQTAGYVNFVVADAQGRQVCAAYGRGADFSDRDWYRTMTEAPGFVVGRMVIGKLSGKPIIPTTYPVFDASGRLQRIVIASLDVAWIDQALNQRDRQHDAAVSLIDAQGVVVARQPHDGALIGKPYRVEWVRTAIAARQAEGAGEARAADGETRLLTFARLADSGLYVVASYSKPRVLARVLADFRGNLLFLGFFTLLTLVAAWFLAEAFLRRPLLALGQAAERIAEGDFTARAGLGRARDELSEVARAFDDMAGSLERSFLQTQRVMEVTPEAILMTDADGRIVMANARTEGLFGYTREELIGQPIELLVPMAQRDAHVRYRTGYHDKPVVREMGAKRLDLKGQRKDGSVFPIDVSLGPLITEQGMWVIAAVRDVSERQRFEAEILHQATHDALTGLPNRTLFRELLVHGMAQAARTHGMLAVLFLDLDGFKTVNDTLGHAEGDALLRETARRIVGVLRKDDVVARQGGDEFTILMQGVSDVQDISQIAEKLLQAVAEPFVSGPNTLHVTASIGVTVFPLDDTDPDNLLRNADTAMYQAKSDGKNACRFYTAEMNAAIRTRLEIENGLRQALRDGQLVLHYQPQVQVDSGRIVGVEALVRWQHPEQGLVPPATFIPIAEESGLIEPIGEWVLGEACRQIQAWRASGVGDVKMAVNLSARQFRKPTLLDTVRSILRETGVDQCPALLELELTESMVMHDIERNVVTMQRLREMGVQLSIDDFGTGYSSLSYLKRFPVHMLKIDRSFIDGVITDAEDAVIAMAIVGLAHNMKLGVIAEGVETAEQWDWLRVAHCDEAQGYHFCPPLPAAEVEPLLRGGQLPAAQQR